MMAHGWQSGPTDLAQTSRNLLGGEFSRTARVRVGRQIEADGHRGNRGNRAEEYQHRPQPTLEDLQPLYQAVTHGCQAGRQQKTREKVYRDRILRGTGNDGFYSTNKLGAFGADLGAVACFFELPWSRVSPALTEADQAWLLNQAAFRLRALGRLTEALEPMRAGLEGAVRLEDWKNAAIYSANLSELELTLGELLGETSGAVYDAEQSVAFADRSGDEFQRMSKRTTLADALHQAGRCAEALALFREAEQMQAQRQLEYPLLYSLRGFCYCDLLLADAERAAWKATLECGDSSPLSFSTPVGALSGWSSPPGRVVRPAASTVREENGSREKESGDESPHSKACDAVIERARQTLQWAEQNNVAILDIALNQLTLGRAGLYRAILDGSEISNLKSQIQDHLDAALTGLRRAGTTHHIPRALLTHAWLRFLLGDVDGARAELDEAWEIAERGPMPLFMADIHLHRARLFHDQDALAAAQRLIARHAYHRRHPELADAQAASEANAVSRGDP